MEKQYRLLGVPQSVRASLARLGVEQEHSQHTTMTVKQAAELSGLDRHLMAKRLRQQNIRDWPTLTRTPAAARQAQIRRSKQGMAVQRLAAVEGAERASREEARIRAGHKTI